MELESGLLKEKIGIDRSVLFNFVVTEVNYKKLKERSQNRKNKEYLKIIYDKNSPIKLNNGKRIGKLIIKDSKIGHLKVSFEKK